ncbi:hypothetical protein HDE69_002663 [Pedobacter cryoconitis]|uniref:Uncharacterized protein n=1 Tax=Pedobacter cryoconitis TaxID=188932 RepID=A0A7W8YTW3_9SPHI|nr:hypothetical protein [Pedobacter cryoconitis]MBB5621602.1 hypothetical protein [Pedobacter cryoconitis]
MPDLNFKITADDAELKKTLANIAKISKDNLDKISKENSNLAKASANEYALATSRAIAFGNASKIANDNTSSSSVKATATVKEAGEEIKRLNNAGKKGYDEVGDKIKASTGKQEILTERLKFFHAALGQAKAPESFVTLNKKIEETEEELTRVNNAGRTGFDELGNKVNETTGFFSVLQGAMSALGLPPIAEMVIGIGKALFNTAVEISGVERAFARLGDSDSLKKLREDTNGLISDFDLEKISIQANNLNIPIEGLGTYLAFAAQRAKETGESVDGLTNDIITGLGTESPAMIDKLGLSQKELNKEMLKTGDFAKAVSNLMVKSMEESGVAVDTLADKTARTGTIWSNLWNKIATSVSNALDPTLPDNDAISKMTQKGLKHYSDFESQSAGKRTQIIAGQIAMTKKFSDEYSKANNALKEFSLPGKAKFHNGEGAFKLNELSKQAKFAQEKLEASRNVQNTLKQKNSKATAKENKSENSYSQNEAEKEISQQTDLLKNTSSKEDRKEIRKNIDKYTAIRDKITGEAEKKGAGKSSVTSANASIAASASKSADEATLNAQQSLQERISAIKDKFERKGLSKEEEARRAITDEFKKLAHDIEQQGEKYDAYAKKYGVAKANEVLGPKQTTAQIEPIREAALEDQKYRQETAKLEGELNKQKELYEAYENWKNTYGEKSAKERYGNDIDTNKTYLKVLQENYSKLIFKSVVNTITGTNTMTNGEQEKLDNGVKSIDQAKGKETDKANKDYQEAYQAAMTYNQKLEKINQEYHNHINAYGSNATEENIKELKYKRDQSIKIAQDEALAKTAIYKELARETILLTREQTIEQLKALESLMANSNNIPADAKAKIQEKVGKLKGNLDIGTDQANLNTLNEKKAKIEKELAATDEHGLNIINNEQRDQILKNLTDVEIAINKLDVNGDGKATFGDKLAGKFSYLGGTTQQFTDGLSKDLGSLSGGFSELSGALGGNNTQAGYLLDTIGKLAKAGSDAVSAVGSFASGDIIGGVTKTISAVASVLSIGKKTKEMNAAARKEVSDYYEQAAKGEKDYQALLRKREIDEVGRGKTSYQAIVAKLELLKKQSPELQSAYDKIFNTLQGEQSVEGKGYEHGTWFRKAKTWDIMASLAGKDYNELEKSYTEGKLKDKAKADFESLKALREELKATGFDIEDLQKQLNEMLTGTSVEGLSDALSDLFDNGKLSAADFGDTFENIMRKAILSSFKLNTIQKAMAPVFDMLSGLFTDGKIPGEEEISKWLAYANGVGGGLGGQFEVINKMLEKLNLTGKGGSTDTVSGSIEKISATQADVLTGHFAGMRIAQLEGNQILQNIGMTGIEQLNMSRANLECALRIEANTFITANNTNRLEKMESSLISIDAKMSNPDNVKRASGY